MTATLVNGIKVISDEPVRSMITKRGSNEPIYWSQIRELALADGSKIYGCLHCDATYENVYSVRPHLNKHRGLQAGSGGDGMLAAQERTITLLGKELDRAEQKTAKALLAKKGAEAEARRLKRELDTLRGILNPSLDG